MDQSESYRRIWQTFRTYERLADGRHDTPDWRGHDGVYALCIVRIPPAALLPAINDCRAELAPLPFVRLHPPHFLHIPLQELGFVCPDPDRPDEITPARLEEFATAAAGAVGKLAPFDLRLGGLNAFQDAVFLDVHDRGGCSRLHARLNALAAVPRSSRFAYLPHTTIAHFTDDRPLDDLPATLAQWRDAPFGNLRVNRIEIVTLRLDQPYPPLEPYAVIPLGG